MHISTIISVATLLGSAIVQTTNAEDPKISAELLNKLEQEEEQFSPDDQTELVEQPEQRAYQGFAKRPNFAFAKRASFAKRPRFAFAKRAMTSFAKRPNFAFAKRAHQGFAFAKRPNFAFAKRMTSSFAKRPQFAFAKRQMDAFA